MQLEGPRSKEQSKDMLNKKINALSTDKKKLLAKSVQFNLVKDLTKKMKNFTNTSEKEWKKTITKLKNYKKVFNIDGDTFNKIIDELLPLLGAYLGALFTFKCNEKATMDTDMPLVLDADGNISDKTQLEQLQELLPATTTSLVMEYCQNEEHGFSLIKKKSTDISRESEENPSADDCQISMCIPDESTNLDDVFAITPFDAPKGVIVEYDRDYAHTVNVAVGEMVSFDNYLGSINKYPVKSHVHGIVKECTQDYFVLDYVNDMIDTDFGPIVNSYKTDEFDKIVELFETNSNVLNYIKDFLIWTRWPHIANHTRSHNGGFVNEVSASKYNKAYRKEQEDKLDKFNKKMKKKCADEYIQPYAKKSKLAEYKAEIDADRKKAYDDMLNFWRNYDNMGYCSKGRIADYLLLDEYLDFITDEEKFYYDDENPYIVRLFKLICKFIGKRYRIENDMDNVQPLIDKFNKLCKSSLKKYWKPSNGDYYSYMKEIFKYEYYTDDVNAFIEAAVTDKNAVSMFAKVKQYLENITNFQKPQDEAIEYSEDMDVKALLNAKIERKGNDNIENELKKISLNFCMLRIIETNAQDESLFKTVANKTIVLAYNILHAISGILIDEYKDNYTGIDPLVIINKAILKPYLNTLKAITDQEIVELDALSNEVLNWYNENDGKVDDPKIFDVFKEIGWGPESQIYKDNEMYDFIYLKYVENTPDGFDPANEPFDFENESYPDSYYNENKYVKSSYGPDSFPYWLRYLTIATLVNCLLPVYWSTGLIVLGVPVILPNVMLPLFVLPGKLTVVFGIGLCGICPMPLILFVNMTNEKMSILIPLNALADTVKSGLKEVLNKQKKVIELGYKPLIDKFDNDINDYNSQLETLEMQIENLDAYIKINKEIMRNMKKRKKKDSTTHKEKKER